MRKDILAAPLFVCRSGASDQRTRTSQCANKFVSLGRVAHADHDLLDRRVLRCDEQVDGIGELAQRQAPVAGGEGRQANPARAKDSDSPPPSAAMSHGPVIAVVEVHDMRRRLFTIVSAVPLLLLAGAIVLRFMPGSEIVYDGPGPISPVFTMYFSRDGVNGSLITGTREVPIPPKAVWRHIGLAPGTGSEWEHLGVYWLSARTVVTYTFDRQTMFVAGSPYRATYFHVSPNVPLLLSIPLSLVAIRGIVRSLRTAPYSREGHCAVCRYNLTGNTSGVCPECGTKITQGHTSLMNALTDGRRRVPREGVAATAAPSQCGCARQGTVEALTGPSAE